MLGGFYETEQAPVQILSMFNIDPTFESMLARFCPHYPLKALYRGDNCTATRETPNCRGCFLEEPLALPDTRDFPS